MYGTCMTGSEPCFDAILMIIAKTSQPSGTLARLKLDETNGTFFSNERR